MDPVTTSALVGAGASMLGGAHANRLARKEAKRNRRFQERMRNTQWQSAVADMEKAGINPALAYSQGGAASPSGSTAGQENIGSGVSSAMQKIRYNQELRLMKAQEFAAAQSGQKLIAEKMGQEIQNSLWVQDYKTGGNTPGPLWNQAVANARSASEIWQGRQMENTLLRNLSDVAKTPQGQSLAWLRYLMQSWKGGR